MRKPLVIVAFLLLASASPALAAIGLRGVGTKANGTTSCAPTLPTGLQTNDIVVAFVVDHATSGSTTLANWTNQGSAASSSGRVQVFTCIVNGTNCNSPSFTSLTTRAICNAIAYYGEDTGTPMDVGSSARINASGTTGTISITPVTNGNQVVAAFASLANGSTWSAEAVATNPGTLTEQADGANSTYCSLAIADGSQATAGATGASSATMSTNAANGAILIAIRPSSIPPLAPNSLMMMGAGI